MLRLTARTAFAAVTWILIFSSPVLAFHDLRQGIESLLGPNYWGIYLLVPVPFLVAGVIGFLIWRAIQADQASESDHQV